MKIAFYDSGLGGLSVLRVFIDKLKQISLNEDIELIYIADTLRAPYGSKSVSDLKSYVYEFADFASNQQVDYFVSACNTSSNLFPELELGKYSFETFNLYSAMKNYFLQEETQSHNYLYLATEANINSQKYLDWGVNIVPVACPKLVPLIEASKYDEAFNIMESDYISENITRDETQIILRCTHNALLKNHFKESKKNIIDPAEILFESFATKTSISSREISNGESSNLNNIKCSYYSSGLSSALTVAITSFIVSLDT